VIDSADIPYFYGGGIAVDAAGNRNAIGTRRIAPRAVTMLEGVAKLDSAVRTKPRTARLMWLRRPYSASRIG
jgi:hypothetical protein